MAKKDVKANKNVKENKNENSKNKKSFFKGFKAELKKVIWPTPKQLLNNTTAVISIVIITGIIVFALDVLFDLGNKYGISQLQNIVNEKFNSEEQNTESTNNTESTESTNNSESTDNSSDQSNATENTNGDSSTEATNSESEATNVEQ